MMASPSELTLDCKPTSYSLLLKSIGEHTDQTQKLQEFLTCLEEERLKIDAFKRELPLCMQLLSNAMEASRQQLQTYQANQGARPVLEEFIPLKNSSSEGGSEKASSMSDKATWMTSAQLWSQASCDGKKQQSTIQGSDMGGLSPKLGGLDTKHRNGGGAFLPFSKERNNNLPDLALADKEMMDQHNKCSDSDDGINISSKGGANVVVVEQPSLPAESLTTTTTTTTTNSQTHRKARRCWSPDLHRRFVNALHMLGGSQVATPKQIRELMKVDGLTNDEVKSHLQKYRLHTRRPSPSPQATGNPAPQLVVLGGIWVPPEYATAAHHGGAPTLYGAHATTNYCSQAVPQEFYPAPTQPQLHHHTLHHQLHVYNPSPQAHSSPDSDIRGGTGDRSESIEDGKSESSSWKADSGGENGGERKGLVLREDGEESHRGVGDIALKF